MATSKEYLAFVLDQLSGLEEITHRSMMGEYMIYYRQKIAAYLCDDRFLVKPTPTAQAMMPNAAWEPPYEGAKEMLVADADQLEDRDFLCRLFTEIYEELPAPKPKKKKKT